MLKNVLDYEQETNSHELDPSIHAAISYPQLELKGSLASHQEEWLHQPEMEKKTWRENKVKMII